MPQATTITLNDGAATPVAHAFEPISTSGASALYANFESVTGAGQMTLVMGLNRSKANRPTDRINMRMAIPIEQTIDGITRVVDTTRVDINFVLPESLSSAQRADVAAFAANMLDNALIRGYVEDLVPVS